jgi:hypothetical protein
MASPQQDEYTTAAVIRQVHRTRIRPSALTEESIHVFTACRAEIVCGQALPCDPLREQTPQPGLIEKRGLTLI